MNKCGRSGNDTNTKCKEGEKRAKAALHLEVLSESEDRAWEEKERCVLYAPQMRAKETRR